MFSRKDKIIKLWSPSSSSSRLVQTSKSKSKSKRKLRNKKQAYAKERTKQREHLNEEIAFINKLREEGSISEDIYTRYQKLLEIGYEQRIQETREKYGFSNL
jgi:hypothetical protein